MAAQVQRAGDAVAGDVQGAGGIEEVPPDPVGGCVRWCRAPGPRDRCNAITDGMVAAVGGVLGPPGLGVNDHGGFRSQFGQQVFEKLVGTAGFEPATP
jgi:hypothetical protein